MRVLVCGSRTFTNKEPIHALLNGLNWSATSLHDLDITIISGMAPGADTIAALWAMQEEEYEGPGLLPFPADWERHGIAAGRIRNRQMLDEGKPDLVVAFVDKPLAESRGTAHMVRIAKEAGVPTWVVEVRP